MARLPLRLGLPEALGLSLSIVSPTVTAAFNITLIVQAVGPAAPLAFAVGALATALIALSFMSFTHRAAHAGSAYAYIGRTFGSRAGFIAGWALWLSYMGFATGFAALVAGFTRSALVAVGIEIGSAWIVIGVACLLVAWWFAHRDMRLAGRMMLALEGAAVAGIIALCLLILRDVHPSAAQTLASLHPSADFSGWTGFGYGMAFSILSFAGFEGAATLGEETLNPRRNIPVALFGTVLGSAVFFIFVAYCEIVGYGPAGVKQLATSAAPLDDLAMHFASTPVAVALDLAAATSCFAGALGALAAAGRVLFALGRAGLAPQLAVLDLQHGTPAAAISVTAVLILVSFLACAPCVGSGNYYSYSATIGVLALILVYVGVGAAELVEAWREQRPLWSIACVFGPLLLLWVLYCNVSPIPDYPNNLWPYVALAWVLGAALVIKIRPQLGAPLPDYSP